MHARNRSPGNGYRAAHAVGMGGVGATASRVSPESSMRSHGGGYSSEYRSYNRGGFGRGQSRQFNSRPPAPLPHKGGGGGGGDIFMEAGKLAAEYLIAKGLLPANALSGKWQNGNLKNLIGRAQDAESGRASALSRLGEAGVGSDSGLPGRRRSADEYGNEGSKGGYRGRKRPDESSKNYGSDWNREMGRSGSWSERSRASDGDDESSDVLSRHRDDRLQANNNESGRVSRTSLITELAPASDVVFAEESEVARSPHYTLEKLKSEDNAGAEESVSSSSKKDKETDEKDDDTKVLSIQAEKIQDVRKNDELKAQDPKDAVTIMALSLDEGSQATSENTTTDLLSLCRFAKFPTRTRSSMAFRVSRVDTDHPSIVNDNAHEGEPSEGSGACDENVTAYNISGDGLGYQIKESTVINLDRPSMPAAEHDSELDGSSVRDDELPDFGRINDTMIMDRGEKRVLDQGSDSSLGNKKLRESPPLEDAGSNAGLSLLDPPVRRSVVEDVMMSQGGASSLPLDVTSYPKSDNEPDTGHTEEKQLLPGSFKTLDLNLMEAASEPSHHHQDNNDTVLSFSPPRGNGMQAVSVNIDLSMHNNDNAKVVPNRYGKYNLDGRDIEVIDLENDSVHDDRDLTTNSDGRNENIFTGLGGFSGNAPNANEIPDSSDSGYGLMISELMGNDIPNCSSSVPTDVDALHNDDMGLDNGEGILGVDDPIYMSLGEIPLSMLEI
ncbi:OLC1v1009892C3 [Oldenlandia corymbosa var. corymbosa]|uniref:OLC1v1009892C3 n=1 Tax=Oldenlandia corymbosa var. corymbosa TaxID=529605 RepID=A0AAV1DT91_OLDCO|nr:OLC1v1009892C3 [Oldenlandia corymbosa var. corymbosa]